MDGFFSGYNAAAIEYGVDGLPLASRRIPPQIEQFYRERVTCAHCHQRINWPQVRIVTRGLHVFHPSCAQRAPTVVDKPAAPRVIASLSGVAVTFDRAGCAIFDRDGSVDHERYAIDCFDASLARGGQELRINHGLTVRGTFQHIRVDNRQLCFRFTLFDGALEQRTLDEIRRGECRGCSVGYRRGQQRRDRYILEHQRADLIEISVVLGSSRPAWYGTFVRAE